MVDVHNIVQYLRQPVLALSMLMITALTMYPIVGNLLIPYHMKSFSEQFK